MRVDEAGVLPIRPGCVVPGHQAVLRPPPTPWWPPVTSRCVGYRRACFPSPAGSGPPRASPVPTTPFWPFHAPYAGGFLGTRSRLPGAVHGLRHRNTGSAPSWSARAGIPDDAAGFASCCGLASRPPPLWDGLPPLRPRALARRRECCYRGPWRLPGPDSHRLAAVSLSLGYVVVPSFRCSSAPELLDAHSRGIAGCIQVTARTYQRLRDGYQFQRRGTIPVRGMGEMVTYFLVGRNR
jgi:hypothetical protein